MDSYLMHIFRCTTSLRIQLTVKLQLLIYTVYCLVKESVYHMHVSTSKWVCIHILCYMEISFR